MNAKERIVCECGGELMRPMPVRCPHCGATIIRVRRNFWPRAAAWLVVAVIFVALAIAVWRLAASSS